MTDSLHIRALLNVAAAAKLDGLDFVTSFSTTELCREYNGIGPEWAGAKIRDKVTKYLGLFEPAALIHDLRNYMSDGSRYGFNYANFEFWGNCVKLAKDAYPWWSWKHWRARGAARLAFDFVSGPGGWKAWMDAFEKGRK